MKTRRYLLPALILAFGCGSDPAIDADPTPDAFPDEDYPLSDRDSLREGWPGNEALPQEGKADQTLPARFDLVAVQSPVKSQGSRGVCSIFGTVGLMEHLYISEGTLPMPDFSEQFLQWSTKVEAGRFRNTSGSSGRVNIDALARFGGVVEAEWPYEPSAWSAADDETCAGEEDSVPVQCHTNGDPPASALEARRWYIPRGRWINSTARSIQAHMFNTNTAVQAGGDFFYQAWNHGRTNLERSEEFRAYAKQGYILPPTPADRMDSSGDRKAGHSYLLVGWDDELSVQAIDEDGNLRVDEEGNPVMVTGFFLFKNSWGTGWAEDNPFGAGYGWIAYEYVERYLTANASGLPEVMLEEVCGDGRDNDANGAVDCADAACVNDRSCFDPASSYASETQAVIPDGDPAGLVDALEVPEGGTISGLSVDVDITHSYRGDLTITLSKGSTSVTLVEREGAGEDDLQRSFDIADFDGQDAAGTWTLTVVDGANFDEGTLNQWTLNVTRCAGDDCAAPPETETYESDTLVVIPEGGVTAESIIEVPEGGAFQTVRVTVSITHPFLPEVLVALEKDGQEEVLLREEIFDGNTLMRTFTLDDFNTLDSAGTWSLLVSDIAEGDQGTLNGWSLEFTR